MLSATATDTLVLADPATLKRSPTSLPAGITLPYKPTAAAWAVDNSVLYLSSTRTIARYDPLSKELKDIFALEEPLEIRCLAVKDSEVVIFSADATISLLQCDYSTAKVLQALTPHKGRVVSLSLSNDSTLLAAASKDSVLVYNLVSGSHSTLRNLPSPEPITFCSFHPHTRTKLLIAAGRQLLVYDSTRLSLSPKTILLNEVISGGIVAIASSPFSKTLVATASADGYVSLIDLDKEKGLFRTLNLKASLTTLSFSPEGATMYLGTKDGRLLIVDLRALDMPPKCVIVSEPGNTVDTLCVQKKVKVAPKDSKGTSTGVVNKAPRVSSSSKRTSTPMKARNASATPSRRPSLNENTGTPRRITSMIKTDKKVLTPSRDPLRNSTNAGLKTAKSTGMLKPSRPSPVLVSPNPKPRSSIARTSLTAEPTQRAGITSNGIRKVSIATKPSSASVLPSPSQSVTTAETSLSPKDRARPRRNVEPTRTKLRSTYTVPSPSNASSSSACRKTISPPPPLPTAPSTSTLDAQDFQRGTLSNSQGERRTPSPELPSIHTSTHPTTPTRKFKGMAVLGLGTPDVKAWINTRKTTDSPERKTSGDKGKRKVVGFHDEQDDEYDEEISHIKEIDSKDDDSKREREGDLSMQISPRRSMPVSPLMRSQNQGQNQSWEASPLRPHYTARPSATSTPGNPHELLRTIVQDVMYDFQQETKAEMMGLHLDLIKMGRGWKQELRTLMDEYVGDLNELREENRRLREENERLRRGY